MNLCFRVVGERLALFQSSCSEGAWWLDGGNGLWGWLELLFDAADVLFDLAQVRYKVVGQERVALGVVAIRLEG